MMRVSGRDLAYAAAHPLRALRYLRHRDRISCSECAGHLPAAPVIVEAGAFDGSNTREFLQHWPECRVHAFEPVPTAFRRLQSVADEFPGRVFAHPLAIGSHPGRAVMHVSGAPGGGEQSSSLLPPAATLAEFPFVAFSGETAEVEVVTLDEWARQQGVERVDFFWLDLQGLELAALRGAERLLGGCSAIHCEVQHISLYEGAVLYPELRAWLAARGFRPVCEAVFRRGGNVLFVRG
jgi:FkbM family methyltransferase